jgi:hypothetical protein
MQLVPQNWTHNHIQRLYHISMLAIFVFIVAATSYGIFACLFYASAGELTQQGAVNVTAIVPGIEPGPAVIQPPAGGGSTVAYNAPAVESQKPATEQNQTNLQLPQVIVSVPDDVPTTPVKETDGRVVSLPSYSTQNPTFQGTTSIKNAIVFLEIHSTQIIRATTYADSQGNWSWIAKEAINPGQHELFVTAQDPENLENTAKSNFDFFVEPTATARPMLANKDQSLITSPALKDGTLFDVLVMIPAQFKVVAPGDDLVANIKLINFGASGNPVDVSVQYIIENSQGEAILQSSQTVAVATQLSILKTFNTHQSLPEGQYKLTVRVPSKDVIATASDVFEVKGTPIIAVGVSGKADITTIFQALYAMLFMFTLFAYLEYNKVSLLSQFIKKVDEQDLASYNNKI